MTYQDVTIETEYITLQQFLKFAEILDSGGAVKWFLEEQDIKVNGSPEKRRGKKLRDGDLVVIAGIGSYRVVQG